MAYRWYVDKHHNGEEESYNRAKLELMAHLPYPIESADIHEGGHYRQYIPPTQYSKPLEDDMVPHIVDLNGNPLPE